MYLTQATGGQILVMTKLGDFGSPQARAALAPQMEGDLFVAVARPSGVGCKEAMNLRTGMLLTGPMADSSEFRAPTPGGVDRLGLAGMAAQDTRDVVAMLTSIKVATVEPQRTATLAIRPYNYKGDTVVEFGELDLLDEDND